MNIRQKHLSKLILLLLITGVINFNCFSQTNSKNDGFIKGLLQLDTVWSPVVYLSHIPTFKDMFKMSNKMIISSAKIDSLGFFMFPSIDLPKKDNLYRLHLSKKETPPASLIIGGVEENHIFFIANSTSKIIVTNKNSQGLFDNSEVKGYKPNNDLVKINKIINQIDNIDSNVSNLKREFIEQTLHEKLRHIADTSSHYIVSLYALNNSQFEANLKSQQRFYNFYLKKWEHEKSSYFNEFRGKLPESKEENTIYWFFIIGIIFFLLGFIINHYLKFKKKNKLMSLSVQERKIFGLMQLGKSNKEISEEFNIGVNTVKTHVSSIYSKLDIKSRKDAMDFD